MCAMIVGAAGDAVVPAGDVWEIVGRVRTGPKSAAGFAHVVVNGHFNYDAISGFRCGGPKLLTIHELTVTLHFFEWYV